MKFTLLQLLILFIPAILLTLLVPQLLKPKAIAWRNFSVADFERTREQEIPAIVICRPYNNGYGGSLDEQKLSYESSMSFVAYRYDYTAFRYRGAAFYDERSPEEKWVIDNGGAADPTAPEPEPLLVLVSGSGETKRMKGLSFESAELTHDIINFLGIPSPQPERLRCFASLDFHWQ